MQSEYRARCVNAASALVHCCHAILVKLESMLPCGLCGQPLQLTSGVVPDIDSPSAVHIQ
eukprot:11626737-Prorocentrum_lima.AAC.1